MESKQIAAKELITAISKGTTAVTMHIAYRKKKIVAAATKERQQREKEQLTQAKAAAKAVASKLRKPGNAASTSTEFPICKVPYEVLTRAQSLGE